MWTSVEHYRVLWIDADCCGLLYSDVKCCGQLWRALLYCGVLFCGAMWGFMDHRSVEWHAVKYAVESTVWSCIIVN